MLITKFNSKTIGISSFFLLIAILLAAWKFRYEVNAPANAASEFVKSADGGHLNSRRTSRSRRDNGTLASRTLERSQNDPILRNPLDWIDSERKSNLGQNYASCLDQQGNVLPEKLLAIGIPPQDIDKAVNLIEILKTNLSLVIKRHIEVEDANDNRYRIRAFREDATPLFTDTIKELTELIGEPTSNRVMSAFPLENFVGFMGAYDTVFRITNSDATNDYSHVDYTYFSENGKPVSYGFKDWNDFKPMLLGALETNNGH